jgi:hypothetical protein
MWTDSQMASGAPRWGPTLPQVRGMPHGGCGRPSSTPAWDTGGERRRLRSLGSGCKCQAGSVHASYLAAPPREVVHSKLADDGAGKHALCCAVVKDRRLRGRGFRGD